MLRLGCVCSSSSSNRSYSDWPVAVPRVQMLVFEECGALSPSAWRRKGGELLDAGTVLAWPVPASVLGPCAARSLQLAGNMASCLACQVQHIAGACKPSWQEEVCSSAGSRPVLGSHRCQRSSWAG
jgi:hypothetical protein